ncbi:hypothetical protein BJ508DRAFT_416554 [Ascobolus immersus RN42]|uniref:VWFA domain-containing protein n=1 Tax=Ascobolus immersus RN42 TaxID=1160509 RepID=A0A3N4I2L9_ASCIM|nr:hypothetical protein BJ508DRAFT_416554 [Ascobolus immersus RN42]
MPFHSTNPFDSTTAISTMNTEPSEPPPPYNSHPPKKVSTFECKLDRPGAGKIVVPGVDSLGETMERLEQLKTFDIAVLVDDSGSMAGRRWEEARKAITTLAPFLAQFDQDGLDLYFLNARPSWASSRKLKDPNVVDNTFDDVSPSGRTPLGDRIDDILDPYLKEYKDKVMTAKLMRKEVEMNSLFLLVITDGKEEGHKIRTEDAIVKVARELDKLKAPPRQIGIQFLQIGQVEEATEFLEKLDDNLENKHKIRDMVDTVTYRDAMGPDGRFTPGGLLKIMLGAVLKEFDRQGVRMISNDLGGVSRPRKYRNAADTASPTSPTSGSFSKDKDGWFSRSMRKLKK